MALLASPDGADDSLTIAQDVRLWTARLTAGDSLEHTLTGRSAWLHVARGQVLVDDQRLGPGDAVGLVEREGSGHGTSVSEQCYETSRYRARSERALTSRHG